MHSHFVLDLNHDDRVVPAIHFLDMPHQGRKGASIGVPVCLAQGAEFFDANAPFELGAREPLEVPLDPVRRVAGETVFQLPNQRSTRRRLYLRAPWITPSTTLKSNFPSCGSTWFQETPTRVVLKLTWTSLGHIGLMYSRLVAVLLCISPASIRNGLPSTISWVAVPCLCN